MQALIKTDSSLSFLTNLSTFCHDMQHASNSSSRLKLVTFQLKAAVAPIFGACIWSSSFFCFHMLNMDEEAVVKVKVKYLRGTFFGGAGHLGDQIFHAPGARLWHYAAELHTLSGPYPLCGSALTNTTDNPFEMCPLKLTDFCLFFVPSMIHNLTRAAYSPNGFHKLS